MTIIDLRSDTVTQPSSAMREVMCCAATGDDVQRGPDGQPAREPPRRESGVYRRALRSFGDHEQSAGADGALRAGDEYIVGQQAHTYKYEGGGAAVLGSIQPQPIEMEADGTLDLARVEAAIKPDNFHFARSRLLTLENTMQGKVLPLDYLAAARDLTRRHGLALHLDGARLFNAAVRLGCDAQEITRHFDTVSVCLSKARCAGGVGALRWRGIHRQGAAPAQDGRRWHAPGWRAAAAGLYALEHNVARLAEDHRRAQWLGKELAALGFAVEPVQTNMVYVAMGDRASALAEFCSTRGIRLTLRHGCVW